MRHLSYPSLLLIAAVSAVIALPTWPAAAQQKSPQFSRNAIYFEAFGQGLLYSINYDYRFEPNISVRVGFSYWSIEPFFLLSTGRLTFVDFPLTVNYLTGEGTSHFELGAGIIPASVSLDGHEIFFGSEVHGSAKAILGTATLGYRAQPKKGGFVFRIGLTPLFTFKDIVLSGGVSFGFAF